MALASIRKKGYLYKLPVKGLVKKWSKRWFVLYATSHEGVIRMEYFDNEACEKGSLGKRTIPLRDCSGITQTVGDKIHPYIFELHSQIGHHVFACETQPDLEEWTEGIKEALHEDKMKRRQKKTQSLVINREESTDYSDTSTKTSGTSYRSEIGEGTYRVTMEENETTLKMALQGEYNLEVSDTALSLIGANSGASIAVWHYKFLKNYGKQHGRFHFETGKSAPTGAGKFICVTTCSKEIFGVVHRNIKKLRTDKEQTQKESVDKQVQEAKATLRKQQSAPARAAPMRKQQSVPDTSLQAHHTPKRSSKEIAGEPTTGKYRSSRNLEEEKKVLAEVDVQNHYTLATNEDEYDPGHLYTAVNKTKKKPAAQEQQADKPKTASGPPPRPQPYTKTTQPTSQPNEASLTPFEAIPAPVYDIPPPVLTLDANRFSYGSARDSRDSALIQLSGNLLGSFDEEEHIYDDTLSPLMSGANNPMGNESFNVPDGAEDLINFDIDKLDDNFFEKLEQLETTDVPSSNPWSTGATGTEARHNPPDKRLSQHQFDQIWDNIFSTLPTTNEEQQPN